MLVAIDCKDYQNPVDVKGIEEFIGLIKDIQANKGVMVAANGFTGTAKRVGEKAGLNLYRLIDTENHDWRTYISVPVICDFRRMEYQFVIPKFLDFSDPREIVLYSSDNQRIGTTKSLLLNRWNSGELPCELGEHRNIPIYKRTAKVFHKDEFIDSNILVNIMVTRRIFFGELSLINVRGFADEYNGKLITRQATTDWLNYTDIERNWRKLERVDEIAVKPVIELLALDTFLN